METHYHIGRPLAPPAEPSSHRYSRCHSRAGHRASPRRTPERSSRFPAAGPARGSRSVAQRRRRLPCERAAGGVHCAALSRGGRTRSVPRRFSEPPRRRRFGLEGDAAEAGASGGAGVRSAAEQEWQKQAKPKTLIIASIIGHLATAHNLERGWCRQPKFATTMFIHLYCYIHYSHPPITCSSSLTRGAPRREERPR